MPTSATADFFDSVISDACHPLRPLPSDSGSAESPFLVPPSEWCQTWEDGSPVIDAEGLEEPRCEGDSMDDSREEAERTVKLETTGVTRQRGEGHVMLGELWAANTIFKNSVAAKLREAGLTEEAALLEDCHSRRIFAQCNGCGSVQIFRNRCDNFFCPECQPKLAKKRAASVAWWTTQVNQPKHVVLTLKNIPILTKKYVKEFKSRISRLRHRKFCANWKGGFYGLEITNEGKGWHVHAHLLVDARWIDAGGLAREWASVTAGESYIVKVKDCRGHDYLREVTKYAAKGSELANWTGEELRQFIESLRGVRTFGVFGSLYGKRTEWREWIASLKDLKPLCACGSCRMSYYDENEWRERELHAGPLRRAMPPPQDAQQEFAAIAGATAQYRDAVAHGM